MNSNPERLLGTLLLVILFGIGYVSYADFFPYEKEPYAPPALVLTDPFEKVVLTAKAAYVLDLTTGAVLYEKDAQAQMSLASLTKLMTARVASETLSEKSVVSITAEALKEEGDSGFSEDQTYEFPALLDFTLLTSSNDGATALAAAAGALLPDSEGAVASFVKKMNETAGALGLSQTFFLNPTGLDISTTTAGAYGSARDVALLVASLYNEHPHLLEATRSDAELWESGEAHNTNTRTGDYPGLLLSKTGYTDLAGGNLAIAFDASLSRPVVVVVLGSTREGRFDDAAALAQAARKTLTQEKPGKERAREDQKGSRNSLVPNASYSPSYFPSL